MSEIGALLSGKPYKLIEGVAVVLHQHHTNLEYSVRATGDVDFGTAPYALKDDAPVQEIAKLGYKPTRGSR